MKKWLVTLAILASGCGAYSEQNAIFVGYNTSSNRIAVVVNDGNGYVIAANGSDQFIVTVMVPKNPVGYGTGPSSIDKQVQVSIAAKNLVTGRLTLPIFCNAGAKIVTTVWYRIDSGGEGRVDCNSSYSY